MPERDAYPEAPRVHRSRLETPVSIPPEFPVAGSMMPNSAFKELLGSDDKASRRLADGLSTSQIGQLPNSAMSVFVQKIDPEGSNKASGTMRLPGDPSGLAPEWVRDPSHRDPNGSRWRHPSGEYLDFHNGRPGKKGWRGKDHWHHNGGDDHLVPGVDEIPEPLPVSAPPQPDREPQDTKESGAEESESKLTKDKGFMEKMAAITGLSGAALIAYVIISEGSRLLFPPRNLVPVP